MIWWIIAGIVIVIVLCIIFKVDLSDIVEEIFDSND